MRRRARPVRSPVLHLRKPRFTIPALLIMTSRMVVSRVPWALVLLSTLMWAPVAGLAAPGSPSAVPSSEDHHRVPQDYLPATVPVKLHIFFFRSSWPGRFFPHNV